jgi:hypothetical protein
LGVLLRLPPSVGACAERARRRRAATRLVVTAAPPPGGTGNGLKPELRAAIDKFVGDNKVVLFMKGNKQFPQARPRWSLRTARLTSPNRA